MISNGPVSFTNPLYTNRYLDLSNNQIVAASAPSAISAMSSLTYLDLSNNAIKGSLPSALAAGLAYVAFTTSKYLLFHTNELCGEVRFLFVVVPDTLTCSTTE